MTLLINLLSFALVLVCLFLGLLILVQLPKKEAGMGTAFGGDAAVAMFGAGSGNTLTKLTKYSAGVFVVLCVLLAWMTSYLARSQNQGVLKALSAQPAAATAPAAGMISSNTAAPAAVPAPAPAK